MPEYWIEWFQCIFRCLRAYDLASQRNGICSWGEARCLQHFFFVCCWAIPWASQALLVLFSAWWNVFMEGPNFGSVSSLKGPFPFFRSVAAPERSKHMQFLMNNVPALANQSDAITLGWAVGTIVKGTRSVLKYMTSLTFYSKFDHQYLFNELVH